MNKKLTYIDMQDDINEELDSIVKDGLTGGFSFDEECAERMENVLYKINYIIDEQQNEIDYLEDAIEHRKHQTEVQVDRILELKAEVDRLEDLTDLQDSAMDHDDKLHQDVLKRLIMLEKENEKPKGAYVYVVNVNEGDDGYTKTFYSYLRALDYLQNEGFQVDEHCSLEVEMGMSFYKEVDFGHYKVDIIAELMEIEVK